MKRDDIFLDLQPQVILDILLKRIENHCCPSNLLSLKKEVAFQGHGTDYSVFFKSRVYAGVNRSCGSIIFLPPFLFWLCNANSSLMLI
jgi:hypothetical protein